MSTTIEDDAPYTYAPKDSDEVLLGIEPPPPRIIRFIAPLLFVALHIAITFQPNTTFFLALPFIIYLSFLVDRISYKPDAHLTTLASISTSHVSTSQRVRERLQTYKTSHAKAIARRDAAVSRETKALDDLLDLQKDANELQTELIDSMARRSEDYLKCRHAANRGRLVYYKMVADWQAHFIDELEKLVRRFRNVAMPKIKGVKPSKGNSNSLTGPLERMESGLKKAQMVTKGQIEVAEKIGEVLDAETKDVEEMLVRVGKAEAMLESVKDGASVGVGADADEKSEGMEGWGEMLEVQMRRLDKYHQGILAEDHEESERTMQRGSENTALSKLPV